MTLLSTSVFAHAFLDEANPRVGSVVGTAPTAIRIIYTEGVEPAFSHIELFDGDGRQVETEPVALDPNDRKQLVATLKTSLAPGHYEVKWNVVSVDTHHTDGHFTFDYQP